MRPSPVARAPVGPPVGPALEVPLAVVAVVRPGWEALGDPLVVFLARQGAPLPCFLAGAPAALAESYFRKNIFPNRQSLAVRDGQREAQHPIMAETAAAGAVGMAPAAVGVAVPPFNPLTS